MCYFKQFSNYQLYNNLIFLDILLKNNLIFNKKIKNGIKIIFSINKINIFTNSISKFQTSLQPFQMYKPGADEEKAENARLVTLN